MRSLPSSCRASLSLLLSTVNCPRAKVSLSQQNTTRGVGVWVGANEGFRIAAQEAGGGDLLFIVSPGALRWPGGAGQVRGAVSGGYGSGGVRGSGRVPCPRAPLAGDGGLGGR